MENKIDQVQPNAFSVYSHASLQRSLEGNSDRIFSPEQLKAIARIDVLLHDIPGSLARDLHAAVHLLASSGSPNETIRKSAFADITCTVQGSTFALDALRKIRAAVGTSTEAWHWADDVLSATDSVPE